MEWMNRGTRPAQASQPGGAPVGPVNAHPAPGRPAGGANGFGKWILVALLFAGAALAVATILMVAFGGNSKSDSQAKFVDTKQMQAVFLNGGQVYFGNIKTTNDKFMRMDNIYYLRVNQQVQPNGSTSNSNQDISLVKLGCELHGPQDQMVINQDQIVFWENLKSDGQVAKAVAEYVQKNPNGQKCTADNTSTGTGTGTGTGTSTGSTTPTTTTPTTKKQ